MDPESNLTEQRQILKRIFDESHRTQEDFESDALRLAELVNAMDEWLSRGGFLPNDWKRS